MTSEWEKIGAQKRQAILDAIPSEWLLAPEFRPSSGVLDVSKFPRESGWFSEEQLDITEGKSACELVELLAKGQITSSAVTAAFCKRAACAHQLTNCLSEVFFDQALAHAKALDEAYQQTGKPKGPLHGLPISLKDNFCVKGVDSTLGFTSWANSPRENNSTLVDILLEAGAVIYCKTNVPTAMMIPETVNNTFGRTLNPLNRALTSGGSSGGEAALIAFRGSPLGVGTDIGGSLRIPASTCGLFTLRPSFGRFPTLGARSALAGQEAVQSVNGPMGHSVRDLELFCKTVIASEPWLSDPRCLPIPWREVKPISKLKIGVMWNDAVIRPTPPVSRALRETVDKLVAAGHEVIDWSPEQQEQGAKLLQRMFVADGGESIRKILEPTGEPIRPELKGYEESKDRGVYDLWQVQLERVSFAKKYLDRWNAAGIDCILCPTSPYASVAHGDWKYVGYTGVFNVLDYSGVSFPCGILADHELDAGPMTDPPFNELCASVRDKYRPEAVHGMPVGLQLVARRLEEEKLLSITNIVMNAL